MAKYPSSWFVPQLQTLPGCLDSSLGNHGLDKRLSSNHCLPQTSKSTYKRGLRLPRKFFLLLSSRFPSPRFQYPLEGTFHYNPGFKQFRQERSHKDISGLSTSSKVLRLSFTSYQNGQQNCSPAYFEFGSYGSLIRLPLGEELNESETSAYFRIHFNFDSGALLITALTPIEVGSVSLDPDRSLLLMAGTLIVCWGNSHFIAEFPVLQSCKEEHKRNFLLYAHELGFPKARYIPSSTTQLQPIGHEHRIAATLGSGTFGTVHSVLRNRDGARYAIKVLNGAGANEIKEVEILSSLEHVSCSSHYGFMNDTKLCPGTHHQI